MIALNLNKGLSKHASKTFIQFLFFYAGCTYSVAKLLGAGKLLYSLHANVSSATLLKVKTFPKDKTTVNSSYITSKCSFHRKSLQFSHLLK